jgi:RES domain-containing protein
VRFWRIAQRRHALDKLCAGTAQFGGRWNPIGTPALYCSTSIALCALEKFVHIGNGPLPPLALVAVDMPDDVTPYEPSLLALPAGWDMLPASATAQSFGGAWLSSGTGLAMKIPSAIVPEECNVVINPSHRDYSRVTLSILRPFIFDNRMLGN